MKLAWLVTNIEDINEQPTVFREYPEYYQWHTEYVITRIVYTEVEEVRDEKI